MKQEIRTQETGYGTTVIMSIDLEWLKKDMTDNVRHLKKSEEIYMYGGKTSDMLFWKEFIERHIKCRKLEVKKFNLLRKARKDQPLHPNTIKACRLCNTLVKHYYTESLELCCDAVAEGHLTEQWYINKANSFKERIELNELEDLHFYK